jgi:hypothetical protein
MSMRFSNWLSLKRMDFLSLKGAGEEKLKGVGIEGGMGEDEGRDGSLLSVAISCPKSWEKGGEGRGSRARALSPPFTLFLYSSL